MMPVSKFFSKADSHKPDRIPNSECVNVFAEILERQLPPNSIELEVEWEIILLSSGVLWE